MHKTMHFAYSNMSSQITLTEKVQVQEYCLYLTCGHLEDLGCEKGAPVPKMFILHFQCR